MRKRIHGKQSVPANILYSPERVMKFPTLVTVVLRCTKLLIIAAGSKSHPSRDTQRKVEPAPKFPRHAFP